MMNEPSREIPLQQHESDPDSVAAVSSIDSLYPRFHDAEPTASSRLPKAWAKTAAPIASGQKLSFGVLFTGLYCRTLKPVPGRPALT